MPGSAGGACPVRLRRVRQPPAKRPPPPLRPYRCSQTSGSVPCSLCRRWPARAGRDVLRLDTASGAECALPPAAEGARRSSAAPGSEPRRRHQRRSTARPSGVAGASGPAGRVSPRLAGAPFDLIGGPRASREGRPAPAVAQPLVRGLRQPRRDRLGRQDVRPLPARRRQQVRSRPINSHDGASSLPVRASPIPMRPSRCSTASGSR